MILLSHLSHARLATTSRSVIKVMLVNQQTLKSKDSICTIKEAQSGLIYVVAYVKPHPLLDNGKMVEGEGAVTRGLYQWLPQQHTIVVFC